MNAFQNDLDALVGEPVPRLLRYWPGVAGSLIFGLLLVAGLTRIDIVVTAPGRLTADMPPVVLQPLSSAVLRELRVRPGDQVTEGQVLAVLDSTFTGADRESLEAQRRALTAQRDRLIAELKGAPPNLDPSDAEAKLQGELQAQRQSFLVARRAAINADLESIDAAVKTERESGMGLEQQVALAREVEEMRAKLAANQSGSRLSVLEARAARLAAEEQQRQHTGRLDELLYRAVSRKAELNAFLRDWDRQNVEELARIGPQIASIEEQLQKAARLDALTMIRAPRPGVVLEVARSSPGSLVREGEPVVTLVPSDVPLIAEIVLRSSDLGELHPGEEAKIKVDSFPWRRYGMLEGSLRAVSRESYQEKQGGGGTAMHRGQITIAPETIEAFSSGDALLPGMTLQAELKVGTRSVLDYFLEPLVRGLQESIREP